MKNCREFRARLGAALEGKLSGAPLAWHEHLVGCSSCRELFAAEEALDQLLACLPEPALPVALARRVLRRLESDRELDRALDLALGGEAAAPADLAARIVAEARASAALDAVLDKLPIPAVPQGLAALVVGRVAAERGAGSRTLDELLDTQVAPKLPADLAETVLAGLERELAPPILRPVFGAWQRAAATAAAVLVVGLLWRLLPGEDKQSPTPEPLRIAMSDPEPPGVPSDPGAMNTPTAEPDSDSAIESGTEPDVIEPSVASVPELPGAPNDSSAKGDLVAEAGGDPTAEPGNVSDPRLPGVPSDPLAKDSQAVGAGGDLTAARDKVPDPELLASLDLLEDWELLVPTDIDLLLGSLDESDAELLLLDASPLETAADTEQSEG